jgi:hypothetical protein
MSKPFRRSSFGKDAVTVRLVLRIGSATNSVARLGKFSGQRYSSAAPFDCGNPLLNPNTGEFALKILNLFGITVAASGGLCGAALAFSPGAAAAPLPTGGPTCMEQTAGLGAPLIPAVLPGPPVVAARAPVPAGVPAGAPVAADVPAGAPVAPAGSPLPQQAGAGKGVPTNPGPALMAGPVVLPGPPPVPTPLSPVPVAGPTLAAATGPLPPCCNP